MEEDAKALIYVMRILVQRGLAHRRSMGMDALAGPPRVSLAKQIRNTIAPYRSFDRNEISAFLQNPLDREFDDGKFIALEPSPQTSNGAAFLWCKWDFGNVQHCKFLYGYFRLAQRHQVQGEKLNDNPVPQFIGYRFESPSWQGDEEHRFYHAQPNSSMSHDQKFIKCAIPEPNNTPTFPLPVKAVVELLLCVVLAVLGKKALDSIEADVQADDRARRNKRLTEAFSNVKKIVM